MITIHVGTNAFFLESLAPLEDEEGPDSGPNTQDWDDLAGAGGAVGDGPPPVMQQARRRRPRGLGRMRKRVIRSQDALLIAVRTDVEALTAGLAGPGMPPGMGYGGGQDLVGKCKERFVINRLDEGYVVTHSKPIAKEEVKEVLDEVTKSDAKASKATHMIDTVMSTVFESIGRGGLAGPTKVFGFGTADGVIGFVREQTSTFE